jgi:hypothetical protein
VLQTDNLSNGKVEGDAKKIKLDNCGGAFVYFLYFYYANNVQMTAMPYLMVLLVIIVIKLRQKSMVTRIIHMMTIYRMHNVRYVGVLVKHRMQMGTM